MARGSENNLMKQNVKTASADFVGTEQQVVVTTMTYSHPLIVWQVC